MSTPVIIVHLRRPRSQDKRTDPLYEFGSFGLTGCHRTNLLSDTSAAGARLAFAQGGDLGFRLVMLTPPIDVRQLAHVREAFWSPASMPLRYDSAPVIIDNDGSSDVDGMRELLDGVNRNTWREKFSSAFRTRKSPLEFRVATGIVSAWECAIADGGCYAESYWEALPYWDPDVVDQDRHGTHQSLLMNARGETPTVEDDNTEASIEDDEATAEVLRGKCGASKRAVKPNPPSGGPRRC